MKNLILLHGALGHSDHFSRILAELSKHFKVYTPLFSGHGETELPKVGITIEYYTQELKNFIEKQNLHDFSIFGHSMGGYVALNYALEKPKNLDSIMTLGTKFNWTETQATKESTLLNPVTIAEKVPKYAELLEKQHGAKWVQLLPKIAEMMIALGKNPIQASTFANIETPVQIMVGDQDNMVSIEESVETYRNMPHAKLCILPHTKHPLDKVRPGLLLDLMKDFWSF